MKFLVGLIGSGIGPSLSPPLHECEAAELGLAYRYERWELDELGEPIGDLLQRAKQQGYRGLNITHPVKRAVLEHLDDLAPEAAAIGAVNTVVFDGARAIGHNTDCSGFSRAFRRGLSDARLDRVVLLGAGGAGTAVAHALAGLGVGELSIVDQDRERAEALAAALGGRARPGTDVRTELSRADGLVHATPTGMAAHPGLPVPADSLRAEMWVAEVVYRPLDTELVRTARTRGCRVLDGGGMAVFQAADAFRLFTGVQPDTERMLRHFAELEGAHARG